MREVTDSLARGLQKRLRREYDLQSSSAEKAYTESRVVKSRRRWEQEIFETVKKRHGAFMSPIERVRDKLWAFNAMETFDDYRWVITHSFVSSKRFDVASVNCLLISNHAVERFLQRSCDLSSATSLSERVKAEMFEMFRFINFVINVLQSDKYNPLVECTLNTSKGRFFLTKHDKEADSMWVIKSFVTPEMLFESQTENWGAESGALVDDVTKYEQAMTALTAAERRRIESFDWEAIFRVKDSVVAYQSRRERAGTEHSEDEDIEYICRFVGEGLQRTVNTVKSGQGIAQ